MRILKQSLIVFVALIPLALTAYAESYTRQENVVYRVLDGTGLIMDVFRPTAQSNGLAIIDTLSGAWYSEQGQINDHMRSKVFDVMCSHGYTVFMVRPGSRTKWTGKEMVDNLHYAVRYIKHNAKDYGIDPGRIGMMGASAGGHLTLMASLTASDGKPEAKDPVVRLSDSVACVAVFFPVTDLVDWDGKPPNYERLGDLMFTGGIKGHAEDEITKAATTLSPVRLPIHNPPPILIIHGDADTTVPLQQSERMIKVLKNAGDDCKLIVKHGGGHGWLTIPHEVETMAQWFDSHLAGKPAPEQGAHETK